MDLKKADNRLPRQEVWFCMRMLEVQDTYESCMTVGRCTVGVMDGFKVEVGLHQGLALSPFLFAMVMDRLTVECSQESLRTMMFAGDTVICSESREQVEEER